MNSLYFVCDVIIFSIPDINFVQEEYVRITGFKIKA